MSERNLNNQIPDFESPDMDDVIVDAGGVVAMMLDGEPLTVASDNVDTGHGLRETVADVKNAFDGIVHPMTSDTATLEGDFTPQTSDNRGYGRLEGTSSETSEASGVSTSSATCPYGSAELGSPAFETACRAFDKRSLGYRFAKRVCDIIFSAFIIACTILLFPITLVVFVVVAVQTKGSPIYVQKRVGQYGKPLNILKVRTMVSDSDNVEKYLHGEQLEQWKRERKVDSDPRIVPIGSFLRKTSLDELPQFLNVLTGSMSVVGVRPVVTDELESYGEDVAEFLSLRPGITGWWQTQARNDATYEDGSRQKLELYYVRHASFTLDTQVFIGTFGAMFKKKTGR